MARLTTTFAVLSLVVLAALCVTADEASDQFTLADDGASSRLDSMMSSLSEDANSRSGNADSVAEIGEDVLSQPPLPGKVQHILRSQATLIAKEVSVKKSLKAVRTQLIVKKGQGARLGEVTKEKASPLRHKLISAEHDIIQDFVPKTTAVETSAGKEEKAAVDLEGRVRAMGTNLMNILRKSDQKEPKSVTNLQFVAREKRDDYQDAAALMKGLAAVEKERRENVKKSKAEYEEKRKVSMEAQEEYEHKEVDTRSQMWGNFIITDKSRHRQQKAYDDKEIALAKKLFFQAEANKAKDMEDKLGNIADARVAEAAKSADAAMNNDEEKFLLRQLDMANVKQKEAKAKKMELDKEKSLKSEAKEGQQKEAAKKAQPKGGGGNSTNGTAAAAVSMVDPTEILEAAADAADGAMEEAAESAKAEGDAKETMEAVKRAEKALERNAKAKVIAIAAIKAEENARNAHLPLERDMNLQKRIAKEQDAAIVQAQVRAKGEEYIGRKAGSTMVKVEAWVRVTEMDISTQMRLLGRDSRMLNAKKDSFYAFREAETTALNAKIASEAAVEDATAAEKSARAAMKDARLSRRQAWRTAYRAGMASKVMGEAGVSLGRIASQNEARALSIEEEADEIEKVSAKQLSDKNAKLVEAKNMKTDAKEHKDHDYEQVANTAISTMENALTAHNAADEAVVPMVAAMRAEAKSIRAKATQLRAAIKSVGSADDEEVEAAKIAEKANEAMRLARVAWRTAERFLKQATDELTESTMTYKNKRVNRERAEWAVGKSTFVVAQRKRYIVLAKEEQATWAKKLQGEVDYGNACGKRTVEAMDRHKKLVANAEPQWKKAKAAEAAATKAYSMITAEEDKLAALVTKGGLQKLSELLEMRKKWALLYFEDAKLVSGSWSVLIKSTEGPVKDSLAALKKEDAALKASVKSADAATGQANARMAASKTEHAKALMTEEMFRRNANFATEQWESTKAEMKKMDKNFALTTDARVSATLNALYHRVQAVWQVGTEKLIRDPIKERFVENARFNRVISMWDRDGAPIGPSTVDSWMNDWEGFLEKRKFAGGEMPNCLKSSVRNRCSQQCQSNGAMIQCTQGLLNKSCSFGIVSRVRFDVKDVMAASSDYWVCRCNSGVMQFTAKETWKVQHEKGKLLKVSYTPDDIDFSQRMHDSELIVDKHFQCFRDFVPWLNHKTDFVKKPCENTPVELKMESYYAPVFTAGKGSSAKQAVMWQLDGLRKRTDCIEAQNTDQKNHPFAELDTLALSAGDVKAEEAYNSVRKQWYGKCMNAPVLAPFAAGTYPGSTDSSVDIFTLKMINDVSTDPNKWRKESPGMKSKIEESVASARRAAKETADSEVIFAKAYETQVRERDVKKAERLDKQKKNKGIPLVLPWMKPVAQPQPAAAPAQPAAAPAQPAQPSAQPATP